MKNILLLLLLFSYKTPVFAADDLKVDTTSVTYGKFGKITIYLPKGAPTSVALFVSGDGGWKNGVVNMAKNVAKQGALVLGIDARHYGYYLSKVKSDCLYPAADFEQLSMDVQKKFKLTSYHKPILIGYSYGAVLVYGILVQAPANTFKGAISLGFCPDIDIKIPMCKGSGLTQHILKPNKSYYLERTEKLTAPFIVLNGVKDGTCPYEATADFLKDMPMAELVKLDKVGHGFSIADNWLPEFNAAYKKILGDPAADQKKVDEMPLKVIRSSQKNNLPMVFMISGDGGWTSFDQSLAESLASNGLSVVGLDAQKYFWNAKTPNESAEAISKAIIQYGAQLDKPNFVLAGYSFGASVIPFIASRLLPDLKAHLKGVVSLSPDEYADFEIHLLDMLNLRSKGKYNVIAEFRKVKPVPVISYFGAAEDEDTRTNFVKAGLKVSVLPGNHHFDDNYSGIARSILSFITARN